MARAPDERITIAKEMYETGTALIEIANQFNIPEGTIRSWKNRGKWQRNENCNATDNKKCNVAKKKSVSIKKKSQPSWIKIEQEYVSDINKKPCTIKELSIKYNINYDYMRQYASDNEWSKKRKENLTIISQKTVEKVIDVLVDKETDRISRIYSLADRLSDKLEQSIDELDRAMVMNKKKTRVIEYKDDNAKGKPTKETIEENEQLIEIASIIDRAGLKQLTGALKDIKDIQIEKDSQLEEIEDLSESEKEIFGDD